MTSTIDRTKSKKITIGFIPCLADLYNRLFSEEDIKSLKDYVEEVKYNISSEKLQLEFGKLSSTKEQISSEFKKLIATGAEMIVIMLPPYCPSGAVVPAIMENNIPVILWASQKLYEIKPEELTAVKVYLSHGVHAVQDIANVLIKSDKSFGILHHQVESPGFIEELESWALASGLYRSFVDSNPTQFGGYFADMLDLQIADAEFIKQCGIKHKEFNLQQIKDVMAQISDDLIKSLILEYKEEFDVAKEVTDDMLYKTARGELTISSLMNSVDSMATGINFQTLCNDKDIGDAIHVAASKLMCKGKGYAGEGDWITASFVYAMQRVFGVASFSEIFSVDYKNNRLLLKHWGEANPQMSRDKPKLIMSGFNDKQKVEFCIISMEFEPGDYTLININSDKNGKGQLISIYGEILQDSIPESYPGPRALFSPDSKDVINTLESYAYGGGSHHLVLVKGNIENILKKLSIIQGWSYAAI